jgi:hypothetical protein
MTPIPDKDQLKSVDRFVLVAGLPTGGTSCVAGILEHLGVPMGTEFDDAGSGGIPYCRYEDAPFCRYYPRQVWPVRATMPMASQYNAHGILLRYLTARRQQPGQGGVIGLKHARAMYAATCNRWNWKGTLVVNVTRDETLREVRDWKYAQDRGQRDPKSREFRRQLVKTMRKYRGIVVQRATAVNRLVDLQYEAIVEDPGSAVVTISGALTAAFGNGPWSTVEAITRATEFVESYLASRESDEDGGDGDETPADEPENEGSVAASPGGDAEIDESDAQIEGEEDGGTERDEAGEAHGDSGEDGPIDDEPDGGPAAPDGVDAGSPGSGDGDDRVS